jgi:hypothetical protein
MIFELHKKWCTHKWRTLLSATWSDVHSSNAKLKLMIKWSSSHWITGSSLKQMERRRSVREIRNCCNRTGCITAWNDGMRSLNICSRLSKRELHSSKPGAAVCEESLFSHIDWKIILVFRGTSFHAGACSQRLLWSSVPNNTGDLDTHCELSEVCRCNMMSTAAFSPGVGHWQSSSTHLQIYTRWAVFGKTWNRNSQYD